MNTIINNDWYTDFFQGLNCEMWERAVTPEWTRQEIDFLIGTLNVQPDARLLDIPCGFGRHTIELAKRGYQLTGVDISNDYVDQLTERILAERLLIQVLHGDILTMDIGTAYDGAYCLGNSFGYVDYEGMNAFVEKVSNSLKPGARWVINSGMVAESILSHFPKTGHYVLGDLTMDIRNTYAIEESCMLTELTYFKGNQEEVHHFKHYVYTLAEIKRLLKRHNLQTIAVYKSTDKLDFQLDDQQMYLVAEKSQRHSK